MNLSVKNNNTVIDPVCGMEVIHGASVWCRLAFNSCNFLVGRLNESGVYSMDIFYPANLLLHT